VQVGIFEDGNLAAIHAKRVTIMPKVLLTAHHMRCALLQLQCVVAICISNPQNNKHLWLTVVWLIAGHHAGPPPAGGVYVNTQQHTAERCLGDASRYGPLLKFTCRREEGGEHGLGPPKMAVR